MKKQHFIMRVAAMMLAAILTVGLFNIDAQAKGNGDDSRMNVVFVIDESKSMDDYTDKKGYRYDALELFLGLANENGNYFGTVSFSHEIRDCNPLKEINGKNEKNSLAKSVKSVGASGYTNAGAAMLKAVELIEEGANPDYESVIILLSDGKDDFAEGPDKQDKLDQAEQAKKDAIEKCKAKSITVYGVCLNPDSNSRESEADPDEISDYANATGGQMKQIKRAEDLRGVFELFYTIIYGTSSKELCDSTIPDDGELVVPFDVPSIGVAEANIIINTLNTKTSYSLKNPSGIGYTQDEMDQMSIKAQTFTVIKVPEPEAGTWELTVRGVAGDQVTVNMVYNSFLEIKLKDLTNANPVKVYSKVDFEAAVTNNGTPLTQDELKKAPVHYQVLDANKTVVEEVVLDDGSTTFSVEFKGLGEYTVIGYVDADGMHKESQEFVYDVVNTAPTGEDGKIIRIMTPFSKDAFIDLGAYVDDTEQSDLSYVIDSSTLKDNTADIDNTDLVLTISKCGSGKLEITATDDFGESDSFTLQVVTINLLLVLAIVFFVAVIIIAAIIIIAKVTDGNKPVMGTIKITAFAYGISSAPETIDGGKGKMIVSTYYSPTVDIGINLSQCYFYHGKNDNYIYFVTKRPMISDMSPTVPQKKIRLDDQMEISIYSDREMTAGLRLVYKPYNNYGGSMF